MKNGVRQNQYKMAKTKKKVEEKEKKTFRKEFKKAISTGLISAAGLIIALAWRDVLTEYVDRVTSINPVEGKIIGALIVTSIAVIVIMLISKYISEE